MTGRRRNLWVAIALAVVLIATAAITVALLRHRTTRQVGTDCLIVGELVQQWQSTTEQGTAWLEQRFDGDAETLTVTHAEDAAATAIRNQIPTISSASIAADMTLWADGIEKMARSQREVILHPDPDPNAPPPQEFLQGSLQLHHAGRSLQKACPSTVRRPPSPNST